MPAPLPITVIVPTLNAEKFISGHLDSMEPWLDLVNEIIVVDSHSEDATLEIIRSRLHHPALRILQHPRGLYQSWNFGIQQATSKYIYISTVGDAITRHGLEELYAMCERLDCDVAISKPNYISEDGEPIEDKIWPIDDILNTLDVTHPIRIEGLPIVVFTTLNLTGAILGSSASNLYRTDIVKEKPFPTDFGTAGDLAWGVVNMLDYRLCVTSERFSTFREHIKAYAPSVYYIQDINVKLLALLSDVWETRKMQDPKIRAAASTIGPQSIFSAIKGHTDWHARLVRERQRMLPWFLNPAAWYARHKKKKSNPRYGVIESKLATMTEAGLKLRITK